MPLPREILGASLLLSALVGPGCGTDIGCGPGTHLEGNLCHPDAQDEPVGDDTAAPTDLDGDGYEAPADCNDGDPTINPEADERCDGLDNDCDGRTDPEDAVDARDWYADSDSDGYGDADSVVHACTPPSGHVATTGDCDDDDDSAHPGATEVWYDGVDSDCVDDEEYDRDGDGFSAEEAGGSDCDDQQPEVNPAATEVCNNGWDDDCDGTSNGCAMVGDHDLDEADTVVLGMAGGDLLGTAVAGTDLTGDGVDDVLIGAPRVDGGGTDAGAVYVLSDPAAGTLDLASAALQLDGTEAGEETGSAVAGAGDTDGDGYLDLLAGSPYWGDGGAAWWVPGPVASSGSMDASGTVIAGLGDGDDLGASLAGAGDMGADGYHDLILGAPGFDGAGDDAGAAWVLSGPVSPGASLSTSAHRLDGRAAGAEAGSSVAGLGDLDGDGFSDVAVGAPGDDTSGDGAGAAFVLRGPVYASLDLADADAVIAGRGDGDGMGRVVAAAGDADGDGLDDLLVSAPTEATGGYNRGAVYLFVGPVSGSVDPAGAAATLLGEVTGGRAGMGAAGAGDVDADGRSDLLVGADRAGTSGAGRVYLLYSPLSGAVDLGEADASFDGMSSGAFAATCAAAGDPNADGMADILIGARSDSTSAADAGATYLLFGAGL